MTVTITSYYPSGKVMAVKVFTNSIDANEERDYLEKCEFEYSVKWDCK
jgi:antitoxin component YwqK of YwqJK toxin-antitoxin module